MFLFFKVGKENGFYGLENHLKKKFLPLTLGILDSRRKAGFLFSTKISFYIKEILFFFDFQPNFMFSPSQASLKLGVSIPTLRLWDQLGLIKTVRTVGGHRRFILPQESESSSVLVCYARESSKKLKVNLDHQIQHLASLYPEAEIVSDYGSGLNFKRPGFLSLLDRSYNGDLKELVVTSRDRLCRFAFTFVESIFVRNGCKITVLSDTQGSEKQELAEDIISIITVFTNRYNGRRRYNKIQKDQANIESIPEKDDKQMDEFVQSSIQQCSQGSEEGKNEIDGTEEEDYINIESDDEQEEIE
jgi:putative resolvase